MLTSVLKITAFLYVILIALLIHELFIRQADPDYYQKRKAKIHLSKTSKSDGTKFNDKDCFRAGVYEHVPVGKHGRDKPRDILSMNLAKHLKAIKVAAAQGVQLILLPEDSLISTQDYNRSMLIEQILEPIPDPQQPTSSSFVLCDAQNFIDWPMDSVLRQLSCAAVRHQIWIAFSFGDKVACTSGNVFDCPPDRHFLYKSIALFNNQGVLVAKYHKMQLLHEHQYNLPTDCKHHSDPVVFYDSPFGRLGFAGCFDLLFSSPIDDLVQKHQIDTLLHSTYWYNYLPFNGAVQLQQSTAILYNINVLGANIHKPNEASYGSGIYSARRGALVHSNKADDISRLLIANLPKKISKSAQCSRMSKIIDVWNAENSPKIKNTHMSPELFHKVPLTSKQGYLQQCVPETKVCCSVFYRVEDDEELVKNNFHLLYGTQMSGGLGAAVYPVSQEFCAIAACKDSTCREYSTDSQTYFLSLDLKAKFESDRVFPSVMTHDAELLPADEWNFYQKGALKNAEKWTVLTSHGSSKPILFATLYGRNFDKDPSYRH